jgi:hypothetical protein
MALAMPEDGTWVVWPHFASYLGVIDGRVPSPAEAKVETLRHHLGKASFTVTGRLARSKGKVIQEFAYASPPGDVTIYVERIRTQPGADIKSRETGIVGHTYALGENQRVLTGRHGSTRVVGLGGGDVVTTMPTDWLNIGDRVGYVVRRPGGAANVMRYHGQERGTGRVPLLQEYVGLVGDGDESKWPGADWACVVSFLNQTAAQTARWAERLVVSAEGDLVTCRIGEDFIRVDFKGMETSIGEPDAGRGATSKAQGGGQQAESPECDELP